MLEPAPTIRTRIMDAAFTAFMRFGYEGTSTAEIARTAHVSKRDLYAHFPSKQAMLEACVAQRADIMRRPLELPVPEQPAALRGTLTQYGITLVRELSRPEVLATFRLAIVNAETAPDVALTLDRSGRVDGLAALSGLLRSVQENGLLAPGDPAAMADLFIAILMRGGLMTRMLMRVTQAPNDAEIQARAEFAAETLWRLYGTD